MASEKNIRAGKTIPTIVKIINLSLFLKEVNMPIVPARDSAVIIIIGIGVTPKFIAATAATAEQTNTKISMININIFIFYILPYYLGA